MERERGGYFSERQLLINAPESDIDISTPEGENELKELRMYKEMALTLDALTNQLNVLREFAFSNGEDNNNKKKISEEAATIAKRVSIYDRMLLDFEKSPSLQNVVKREQEKATKSQAEEDARLRAAYIKDMEDDFNAEAEEYWRRRKEIIERNKLSRR